MIDLRKLEKVTDPELIGTVGQSAGAIFPGPVDDWLGIAGCVAPQSDVTADLRPLTGSTCLRLDLRLCVNNTFTHNLYSIGLYDRHDNIRVIGRVAVPKPHRHKRSAIASRKKHTAKPGV